MWVLLYRGFVFYFLAIILMSLIGTDLIMR
jgi:hypothetical protein